MAVINFMDIKGAVTVKTLNKEHSLIKSSNEVAMKT